MRPGLLPVLLSLLVAGCVSPDAGTADTQAPTQPTAPTATTPSPEGPGEDGAPPVDATPVELTLYYAPGYKLTEVAPSETTEPERVDPAGFYLAQAGQELALSPWLSEPFAAPVEIFGDVTVRLTVVADQPAQETTPRAGGFPPSGGWLGTQAGKNYFHLHQDAPAQLQAGQPVSYQSVVQVPASGLFIPAGERFSPHSWTAWKAADGSPVKYVLGGADPSRVTFTVRNVTLPERLTTVEALRESGEMAPHPGFSTSGNPNAVALPLELPAGTAYAVIATSGASTAGDHCDLDFDVATKGGEALIGGHGPTANEHAILGPGMLAQHGLSYEIRASASTTSPCAWTLTVTAHVAQA